MKRQMAVGVVAVAAAAMLTGMTGSAYAAGPSGAEACPSGNFCLYYNSPGYGWGSFEHWSPGNFPDLGQYSFRDWGNGSGYGQSVVNNAASFVNNTGVTWTVYNQTGTQVSYYHPGTSGILAFPNGDWSMYGG
ncbi:peptidase inhibitor family I36 protein [Streptacidiphilus sp. N1-12]|uniref:Peptidase inhibitor family I36 protein n=2 Tax=Streptacidiphilus alkalitolerans TaxID=3342712 RepID=A0ABV6X2M4_9ACTN